VRLGEQEAPWAARLRPCERDDVVQRQRTLKLVEAPRAGERVDRPPLPGQAADDDAVPGALDELGSGERADYVAAAADPDAQDARDVRQPVGDGGGKQAA